MISRADVATFTVARAVVRLAAAAALATAGCHPPANATYTVPNTFSRETLITEEDIARMSARTAWDVVRMRAPRLASGADSAGRQGRIRIQEPHSVNADETPLLIVEQVEVRRADVPVPAALPEGHAAGALHARARVLVWRIDGQPLRRRPAADLQPAVRSR